MDGKGVVNIFFECLIVNDIPEIIKVKTVGKGIKIREVREGNNYQGRTYISTICHRLLIFILREPINIFCKN